MTLEERLQRLEDDRAIRDLKARYLRACDHQDADTVRDCLLPEAKILFEGFPPFDNREDFVAVYRQFGCVPGVHDIHHAANGVIRFNGMDQACGQWSLYFYNINLAQRTATQFGIEYDDEYVRRDGRWWIAKSQTRRKSVRIETIDSEGRIMVTALGESAAAFGKG